MSTKETIACSLCGKLSEATMNNGPLWGLVFNPFWLGGYEEFVDPIPDGTEQDNDLDKKISLCHDCSLELFRFLKVKPQPIWHPWVNEVTQCCEYGYNPHAI